MVGGRETCGTGCCWAGVGVLWLGELDGGINVDVGVGAGDGVGVACGLVIGGFGR
jgi:hypothetical protein